MFNKSLEQIAKKMFADFAMKRTGMWVDWRYLSPERRLAWMTEVQDTFDECLNILQKDLSINLQPSKAAASYEKGFVAGQAHEAHRLNERIEAAKQLLANQLEDFIAAEAKKDVG